MKRAVWLVAAAAACLLAGGAGVVKVHGFVPVGPGLVASPDADGMATLKYDERTGLTRFHLVLHNLEPNTTYCVIVSAGTDFVSSAGVVSAFTTDSNGNGHFKTGHGANDFPNLGLGDDLTNPVVEVFIWDGTMMPDPFDPDAPPVIDMDAFFDVTAEEERVVGVGEF